MHSAVIKKKWNIYNPTKLWHIAQLYNKEVSVKENKVSSHWQLYYLIC